MHPRRATRGVEESRVMNVSFFPHQLGRDPQARVVVSRA